MAQKIDDMERVAEILSKDFLDAVRGTKSAQQKAIDEIVGLMQGADEKRRATLKEADDMQREAARLAKESLDLVAKAESQWQDDKREILHLLSAARPAVAKGKASVHAIGGGRAIAPPDEE